MDLEPEPDGRVAAGLRKYRPAGQRGGCGRTDKRGPFNAARLETSSVDAPLGTLFFISPSCMFDHDGSSYFDGPASPKGDCCVSSDRSSVVCPKVEDEQKEENRDV